MKVIIAGSRTIQDSETLLKALECIPDWSISEVISGLATGPDTLGDQWAREVGIHVKYFPAEWDKHGKGAGYIRNIQMAEYADALLALWDGNSRGTYHMMGQMMMRNKPLFVYMPR
jgi:hypothetical protein